MCEKLKIFYSTKPTDNVEAKMIFDKSIIYEKGYPNNTSILKTIQNKK